MMRPDTAHKMLEALQAAIACGMVPSTSARDGGAAKFSEQVRVADMIRDAVAQAEGSAHQPVATGTHASLREHAILAWRALEACAPVLATIEPESTDEGARMQALQQQVQAAALGLFADLWPGHYPDLGEPSGTILPRECIAHAPTVQDLDDAALKLTQMGLRLGRCVHISIEPKAGP
jgi:hypothetical protein